MAEGHRGRYRDRFENESIDNIPEYAVLEKILHGVIVRQDTSELARTLIREFGSLAEVIDAPDSELQKIKGIGPAVSAFLKSIPPLYERYSGSKVQNGVPFESCDDVAKEACDCLMAEEREVFMAFCFDGNMGLISRKIMFEGIPRINTDDIKKIVDYAVASKASNVILVRNVPSGAPEAFMLDTGLTKQIYNMLAFSNVHLEDVIIVRKDKYVSMTEKGKMPLLRNQE